MTQTYDKTQTYDRNLSMLQEIEQNNKEIAEREAASIKILQDVTAIGEMMQELNTLAKLQAPMLGIFFPHFSSLLPLLSFFSPLSYLCFSFLLFILL
jgi:hypothetical protein